MSLSDELALRAAKTTYEKACEETDRHRMYEGTSTKTGNAVYQREVDAARAYIRLLERE